MLCLVLTAGQKMAVEVALNLNTNPNVDSKVALVSSWPTAFRNLGLNRV